MRRRAGTDAALAACLCGILPVLYDSNTVIFGLTLAAIAILLFSAIIILLHDCCSVRIWKWLVARANSIEVEYSAAGFGVLGTGLSLFGNDYLILRFLSYIMFLVSAALIGFGIGNSISPLIKYIRKISKSKAGAG